MLPELFLSRMRMLLGEEYDAFLSELSKDAVRALRVNNSKTTPEIVQKALACELQPISYATDGFIFELDKIGRHPLHHAGAFYIQDPGAMATLHALPIKKGWRVADFCAAPGGKSSQLSAYVGETGFLLSNEINHARCKVLAGNLERLGCRNTLVTNTDAETLASWFDSFFDLVLVDAPCSGEGMFRKYEHATTEWSQENVLSCAARQKEILDHAAKTVACGGYLLYSTCTYSQEENEMCVDAFLATHEDFSVCDVLPALKTQTSSGVPFDGATHPEALLLTRRFYPHFSKGEGQFIALLKKDSDNGRMSSVRYKDASERLGREELRVVELFLDDVLGKGSYSEKDIVKYKDTIVFRPSIPIPSYGVYMPGVAIGTVLKGRLEPHHQFFSAMGHRFVRRLMLTSEDERVERYLRGETLPCDLPNGYASVLVDGCALGGVKVTQGVAKNHYPKGLRNH